MSVRLMLVLCVLLAAAFIHVAARPQQQHLGAKGLKQAEEKVEKPATPAPAPAAAEKEQPQKEEVEAAPAAAPAAAPKPEAGKEEAQAPAKAGDEYDDYDYDEDERQKTDGPAAAPAGSSGASAAKAAVDQDDVDKEGRCLGPHSHPTQWHCHTLMEPLPADKPGIACAHCLCLSATSASLCWTPRSQHCPLPCRSTPIGLLGATDLTCDVHHPALGALLLLCRVLAGACKAAIQALCEGVEEGPSELANCLADSMREAESGVDTGGPWQQLLSPPPPPHPPNVHNLRMPPST